MRTGSWKRSIEAVVGEKVAVRVGGRGVPIRDAHALGRERPEHFAERRILVPGDRDVRGGDGVEATDVGEGGPVRVGGWGGHHGCWF